MTSMPDHSGSHTPLCWIYWIYWKYIISSYPPKKYLLKQEETSDSTRLRVAQPFFLIWFLTIVVESTV